MKLDVSDKQGGQFTKPHFRKGYYPAQVISIEARKDTEGNLFVGQYGNQMIVKFQIYEGDSQGNAVKELELDVEMGNGSKMKQRVELPKFVYYTYKDKKTGELSTAITPNSAITRMFKALGWQFDPTGLETEDFIGKWAEVNIDDYEYEEEGVKKKASTIKDINEYEGEELSSSNVEEVKDSLSNEIDLSGSDNDLSKETIEKISVLEEQVRAGIIEEPIFENIKKDLIEKDRK